MTTTSDDTIERRTRRAAVVVGVGLAVQLVAALHWTPATFIAAAAFGVPLVLAGTLMFLRVVWKNLRDKGAA
jgi:hypothetical protein